MKSIWRNVRTQVTVVRGRITGFVQIAVILLIVTGAVIYAQAPSEAEAVAQSSMPTVKQKNALAPLVSVVAPSKATNQVKISATGAVVVRNSVALIPQVTGRIVWVAEEFKRGGSFEADKTLLKIDPIDFELALEQAQAQKDIALSALELAEAQRDAAIANYALLRPGVEVPPLVAKLPQVDQARAQLAAAVANENVARLNLARANFSLPFSGRVVVSSAEVGQMLNQGQAFGEVFADDTVEAMVPLSPDQIEALAPVVGRSAVIDVGGRKYEATVERVAPVVDDRTRFAQIYLGLRNTADLFPGAFLNVEISGPQLNDTFLLPEAAEQINQSVWAVVDSKLTKVSPTFLNRNNQGIVTMAFDSGVGVVLGTVPGGYDGMTVRVEGAQ